MVGVKRRSQVILQVRMRVQKDSPAQPSCSSSPLKCTSHLGFSLGPFLTIDLRCMSCGTKYPANLTPPTISMPSRKGKPNPFTRYNRQHSRPAHRIVGSWPPTPPVRGYLHLRQLGGGEYPPPFRITQGYARFQRWVAPLAVFAAETGIFPVSSKTGQNRCFRPSEAITAECGGHGFRSTKSVRCARRNWSQSKAPIEPGPYSNRTLAPRCRPMRIRTTLVMSDGHNYLAAEPF